MPAGSLVPDTLLALRRWLDSSHLKPGARLPSERALAVQLQLNHYALNRAMNQLIQEGLIERNGYKLTYASRKRSHPAGFTCDLVLAWRSVLMPSYRKVARELGINLRVHLWHTLEDAISLLQQMNPSQVECLVFDPPYAYPPSSWEPAMQRLLQQGIPAVSIRQQANNIPCVLANHGKAMELLQTYLRNQGHTEIALVTIYPRATSSIEVLDAWRGGCATGGFGDSARRVLFQSGVHAIREDVLVLSNKLVGEWENVTAVINYSERYSFMPAFLQHIGRHHRVVPRDLSVICLGDMKQIQAAVPSVSVARFDIPLIHETAFRLAQRMSRMKNELGILPPPACIRVDAELVIRASSGAAPSFVPDADEAASHSRPEPQRMPYEVDRQELESVSRRTYDLAARAEESRFSAVNLSEFVNRPLAFQRGWLGDLPLKNMHAGRHVIHGVPFQVLGGAARNECGAVVFHSAINIVGNSQKLPDSITIPIGQKARALYVLHGCGYARYKHHFATYDFQMTGSKSIEAVPLICLGEPPPDDEDAWDPNSTTANIQDWWPDLPHLDYPHSRRAPIFENDSEDTRYRHVYLYTLEWINPKPDVEITHLEVKVDSSHSTTLGMLAVTALK
ncbi:MAG: GntR family transcriptional regulator [Candidatus Methylacidiphilales bacterium]